MRGDSSSCATRENGPSPQPSPLRTGEREQASSRHSILASSAPIACRSLLLPRLLQPHINSRRVPIIRLIEDVHQPIPVQIRHLRFVHADAGGEFLLAEIPFPVAEENPRFAIGVIRFLFGFGPLRHLGGENIEIAVAIHVGNLKTVPVDDIAARQIVADPVAGLLRIALAFIPLQRSSSTPSPLLMTICGYFESLISFPAAIRPPKSAILIGLNLLPSICLNQ